MAISESIIGLDSPEKWEQALASVPHGYWHTWRASHAIQSRTGAPAYLYLCEESTSGAIAACPFMEREWRGALDIYTPAGFTGFVSNGEVPALRRAWERFVHDMGYVCGYFSLHPLLSVAEYHTGIDATNDLFVVDLTVGPDRVFQNLSLNVKRTLKRWEGSGAELVTDRERLSAFLLKNYGPFMRDMNARPASVWSRDTIADFCEDPNLLMLGVIDSVGLCAVVSFGFTEHCAEYHLNVNVRDGRAYTAPLIWAGMRRLMELKVPKLHLGGGIRPGDGVARAKERYGPVRLPLRAAREIYDTRKYGELCRVSGVGARLADSQFFPAYRASLECRESA